MFFGIPPISTILPLLFDENYCIDYLKSIGVFYENRECPACMQRMKYYESIQGFRYPKKNCRKMISLKANSFFNGCKLNCSQIMHIGYLWLTKVSVEAVVIQTGIHKQTICDYFKYFRDLISSDPIIEENKIGGEGVIVELDESKISKRKYNRGRRIEGVWLFGGIEQTAEKKTFFVPIEKRDSETLLRLIAIHVLPGSIIYTDCWRGYSTIQDSLGLLHLTVNHSIQFVNSITGVHTNTIEATWGCFLKIYLSSWACSSRN